VTLTTNFNRGFVGRRRALDTIVNGAAELGGPLSACTRDP
jgi:hypothetical protein